LFEGRLDEAELLGQIERTWLRYPRYRQRIRKRPLGRMEWVDDPTFDLRAHFRRVAVPAPYDLEALRQTVGELMSFLLDRSKPLWSMHLIEGGPYGDALLIRVHHAIGDGMTLLKTTLDLFKDEPAQKKAERSTFLERFFEPISDVIGVTQSVSQWVKEQAEQGIPTADKLLLGAEQAVELSLKLAPLIRDPDTILTGELSRRKVVSWTPPIPVKEFKRVARAFEVTVNDLALAVIAGALRRYFIAQEQEVPKILHASVPIYLGSMTAIRTGNNFGLVLVPLPLREGDARRRVALIHQRMERLKKSPEAALVSGIFNSAGRLPPGLVARMFNEVSRKASLVVTSVPGPPYDLPLAGATVRHIVPLVPLSGRIGLGIAIASYNRKLSLGIQADGARIKPDLRALIELLRAELALLTSVAEQATERESSQCAALTLDGNRCRNHARKGHLACWVHRAVEEDLRETSAAPE
ncbi:MAG: wax ester/triacylglycerol synthase domain-containing protein, partial [Ardenticatenaceae bacterium]